jgi:K+-transporting ATPase ATPase C chain
MNPIVSTVSTVSVVRPALSLFVFFSVLTGVLYPLVVTGAGQALFPAQAAGSLITQGGVVVGSSLIGQAFSTPRYFWSRPSATGPMPYNAANSSGANQGPLNPALVEAVKARIAALHEADPGNTQPVPVDLVTTSASGLDPHISVAAALYQVARVARARQLSPDSVRELVNGHAQGPLMGWLGEARVNVLALNLALDQRKAYP